MRIGMVVPTLGRRPDYLTECLTSLLHQEEVELSVVLAVPPNVSVRAPEGMKVVTQRGSGIAAAVTTGWDHFGDRVDALAWLGDDDRLPSGSLAGTAAALRQDPRASFAYGRVHYLDPRGTVYATLCPGRAAAWLLRLGHNLILQPGCLYRRTAVRDAGGLDHSLRLAFDVDLHRRLLDHGRAVYLPRPLGEARHHTASLTVRHGDASRGEATDALTRRLPSWARRSRSSWAPVSGLLTRATVRFGSESTRKRRHFRQPVTTLHLPEPEDGQEAGPPLPGVRGG